MIRDSWYMAGPARKFKGEPQKKVITGLTLVMWRDQAGTVVAFDGRCPHKAFPLWESKLLPNGTLQCGYHGMCFDSTGQCVDIPSQRDVTIGSAIRLKAYPVVEQDGLVWVWPGNAANAGGVRPPRVPELLDPNYEAVIADPPVRIRANYRLLIENILDITHFYPLHDGNIGDLSNSFIVPEMEQFDVDGNPVIRMSRSATAYQLPPFFQRWFGLTEVDRVHTHTMTGPSLIRVDLRVAPAGRLGTDDQRGYIVCNTNTPVDENHLEWHWIMIARAGLRYAPDPSMTLVQGIVSEFPQVVREDEWALARQHEALECPQDYSDGTSFREVNLRADQGVVAARRVLGRMEEAEGGRLFGLR